jgi:hypothetical protein
MTIISFESKYIKYKTKYFILKNKQIGGNDRIELDIEHSSYRLKLKIIIDKELLKLNLFHTSYYSNENIMFNIPISDSDINLFNGFLNSGVKKFNLALFQIKTEHKELFSNSLIEINTIKNKISSEKYEFIKNSLEKLISLLK